MKMKMKMGKLAYTEAMTNACGLKTRDVEIPAREKPDLRQKNSSHINARTQRRSVFVMNRERHDD